MTPDEQKQALEERISQAVMMSSLAETPGWQFLRAWLDDNLKIYDEALKSTQFVMDHEGYLNARALFMAYKNVIEFIEGTINDGTDARRELRELDIDQRPADATDQL